MKNPHYCTQRNIWNILIYIYIRHQHCTDEAQKAETVLSAVIYIYIYIYVFINTESSQLFDFDNSVSKPLVFLQHTFKQVQLYI